MVHLVSNKHEIKTTLCLSVPASGRAGKAAQDAHPSLGLHLLTPRFRALSPARPVFCAVVENEDRFRGYYHVAGIYINRWENIRSIYWDGWIGELAAERW